MNYDIEVIHLESVKKLRDRGHSSLTSDDSLECCHRNNKRDIGFPITCFIGFAVCERCGVDGQLDRSASIAAANVSYQHGSAFFGLLRFGFLGFTHVQHIPSLGEVRRTFSSMIIKESNQLRTIISSYSLRFNNISPKSRAYAHSRRIDSENLNRNKSCFDNLRSPISSFSNSRI